MTPTSELRSGDTVLVIILGGPRHHRAGHEGPTTDWREIVSVTPNPDTGWEYRKPATSARWSIQFADGCYAGSTRTTKWIVKPPAATA